MEHKKGGKTMVSFEMVIRELANSENDRYSEKHRTKGMPSLQG